MSRTESDFIHASRAKLRFLTSKGALTVEDLWDLPLTSTRHTNLNDMAKSLNRALRDCDEEDFVKRGKGDDKREGLERDLRILKYVIDVRLAETAARAKAQENQAKVAVIDQMIATRKHQDMAAKSLEELQAERDALTKE